MMESMVLEEEKEKEEEKEEEKEARTDSPNLSSSSSSSSSAADSDSEEQHLPDITELRRERRAKRRHKRQERLKTCCSGCDKQDVQTATTATNTSPAAAELPSPIAISSGMKACSVIKTFESVADCAGMDSEEEINAAIDSYSSVGSRLGNVNSGNGVFSDVESHDTSGALYGDEAPSSDPDLLVCDYSKHVGEKLAHRSKTQESDSAELTAEDGLQSGGMLLCTQAPDTAEVVEVQSMSVLQLRETLNNLNVKLQDLNEELVGQVKERDHLQGGRAVVLKHIAELTSLAQGKRANDASAFRKIVVSRETHF